MFISILIPVYKKPKLLEDIIEKILRNRYEEKEILVAIDGETNLEIEKVVNKYRDRIVIHYNGIRQGKVNSLNHLSEFARGEALLFLDNDVELPDDRNFLYKLACELRGSDIVEMPKEAIVKNFFSKIISYDFLSGAVMCFIITKIFKSNLFLAGAAFAIRKDIFEELGRFSKVVSEDWEMIMKAFSLGKKYSFPLGLKVKTAVPSNFNEWIEQRKRWVLGIKFWWIELVKNIKMYMKGIPIILCLPIVSSIPGILALIIWKFAFFSKLIPVLIMVFQHLGINPGISSFIYSLSILLLIFQGTMQFVFSLLISIFLFFIFSKLLKFRFNAIEFTIYSVIYLPFLLLFYLFYSIVSFFTKPKLDWVIASDLN